MTRVRYTAGCLVLWWVAVLFLVPITPLLIAYAIVVSPVVWVFFSSLYRMMMDIKVIVLAQIEERIRLSEESR